MSKIKKFMNSKMRYFVQCSAFMVAIYAANSSCILIFHQEEQPEPVRRLSKFYAGEKASV